MKSIEIKSIPDNNWKWGVGGLVMFCVIVAMPFLRLLGVL